MSPIRTKAQQFLDQVPSTTAVTSNGNTAALFTKLTGFSHERLQQIWAREDVAKRERREKGQSTRGLPTTTSCNSFVGQFRLAIGLSIDVGRFDVRSILEREGLSAAWILPVGGARPGLGDVFKDNLGKTGRLHVGVSLGFEGDTWLTVEGGQGGPGQDYTTGFDKVCRKRQAWDPSELEGWVDIEVLARLSAKPPQWLIGWWQFDCAGAKEWVYLPARGEAQAFAQAPANLKTPPATAGRKGQWTLDGDEQGVAITWANSVDGPDVLRHLPAVGYMLGSRGAKSLQAFKR